MDSYKCPICNGKVISTTIFNYEGPMSNIPKEENGIWCPNCKEDVTDVSVNEWVNIAYKKYLEEEGFNEVSE